MNKEIKVIDLEMEKARKDFKKQITENYLNNVNLKGGIENAKEKI